MNGCYQEHGHVLFHLAFAALRACVDVRAFDLPLPANPPSLPSETAAGFFRLRFTGLNMRKRYKKVKAYFKLSIATKTPSFPRVTT